ncbi:UDP-N-acetylglucosamine 1-carboxyvinyltransferase [Iamia majanohamensis]|uniref:UDP-N-acetylglucosamine 1-carboxyvinyltransferase n=1 Tax=Iamia majanohamensis TaxID=467976 RepID=A0AAF0BV42_9ACTN|nr:UDP-N-acetylglucosamine 1-carboxyvinyltransferase [Iamia majanohamensis]WCO66415.1 UDP-N-acetylglucosamine 1-carboxyvinyltransferase [Iamia majanohamensis]
MERIVVRGAGPLEGRVPISGAKNSVLKLMAATLLCEGRFTIRNVPDITDVRLMSDLLRAMGSEVSYADSVLTIDTPADTVPEAPYELVEAMRASIVVLGPLVARLGRAKVSMPGGDDFGQRPVDWHLDALRRLGVELHTEHGYIEARTDGLRGTRIVLEFPSVGATENALMAAVLAEGTTVIENAAKEPELADLAAFLNRMGASVLGAGSSTVTVEGVGELHPVDHEVIPDRLEAATFLTALAVAGGELILEDARPEHMDMLMQKLGDMGLRTSAHPDGVWASAPARLQAVDINSLPYPGVATDYMPLVVAALSVADGAAIATENIFGGRFRYVDELTRMGADIRVEHHYALIRGVPRLSGAPVKAHDIRAGAALVVAALGADGETVVSDAEHVARGYDRFVEKLTAVGADVRAE